MVFTLPKSEFVGFDIAKRAIARGNTIVDQLKLQNIRLNELDLLQADASIGHFDFIIAHGLYSWVPAVAHGSARLTQDVDVVYSRFPENLVRIVRTLAPYAPYLRGAPPGLPFRWSVETARNGLNFTLTTTLGDIDLLWEIAGGGNYESLLQDSIVLRLFGIECRCVSLRRLILLKRAAGRPRDLEAIAELEAILEEE